MRAIRDPALKTFPSPSVGRGRGGGKFPAKRLPSSPHPDAPHGASTLPIKGRGKGGSPHRAGYSLLEVLLAVSLIALAGTIAVPSLINSLERREARTALSALEAGMTGLRYRAVLSATPLEIAPEEISAAFPGLPEGWRVTADSPLKLSAGGLCDGNTLLTLTSPDRRLWRRRPAAHDCTLE